MGAKAVKRKPGRPAAEVARPFVVSIALSGVEHDTLRAAAGLAPLGAFVREVVLEAVAAGWVAKMLEKAAERRKA